MLEYEAVRSLYYIRLTEGLLEEIIGDRYSVGTGQKRAVEINNHTLRLQSGGYALSGD
ncbi:hypothetical protein [Eisenibacter elegans]|uniref:hypothetical protein n=1 Tax=Eisenibacter elegans TaxID=997 RepID=UPI0013775086|nr:hypothetical protein [Eisenibacter elegans]